MNNVKERIINEIEKHVDVFHKVSPIRYRIRCPFCGDSQSNPKDSHLYLKCDNNSNSPIVYYCFKGNCGAKGIVGKDFLARLGISNINGLENLLNNNFNKLPYIKKSNLDINLGNPNLNSLQVKYIEKRIGIGFTYDDYKNFKIVWNMNNLIPYIDNIYTKNTLPSNYNSISFLSDDKSSIFTRFFDDSVERWKKSKLFKNDSSSFYTIKTTIDLFSKSDININIAEGIFDILSIYKNFNEKCFPSVNIAILGSDYESGIKYAINNGFLGDNIIINLYIDSNINQNILKNKIKKYKWIFKKINIFKNIKWEDFGTTINNIERIEYYV